MVAACISFHGCLKGKISLQKSVLKIPLTLDCAFVLEFVMSDNRNGLGAWYVCFCYTSSDAQY